MSKFIQSFFCISICLLTACGGGSHSKLPESTALVPDSTTERVQVSGTVTSSNLLTPIDNASVFITSRDGHPRVSDKVLNMDCLKPSVTHEIALCTKDDGYFALDLVINQQYTVQVAKGASRETIELDLRDCHESTINLGSITLSTDTSQNNSTTVVTCHLEHTEDIYNH